MVLMLLPTCSDVALLLSDVARWRPLLLVCALRPLPTTQYSVVVRGSLLMDVPLAGAAPKAPPFPPAPPLPPPKFVHPLMLNALSTAKGAVLGGLVTNGYLKECFTLGKNYSREGNWKLECRLCRKEIVTGEGRTQNVLMHLSRQHVDSIDATVLREIVKMFATHEKEEKLTPVTARLGFESSGVKRSSHDASHDAVSKIDAHSLRRALAEWMIADGLPFYAIEGRGFHNLMNLLRPDIEYPGRLTVMKELPLLANELQLTLRLKIESMLAISFTLDFWSAKDKFQSGFMCVNLTGITSKMDFLEATIAMELIPGKHTGSVTAKAFAAILDSYDVIAKNIGVVTTDDGSNMQPGMSEFLQLSEYTLGTSVQLHKERHLLCFGHLLNNVWGDCSKEVKATTKHAASKTKLFIIVDVVRKVIFLYAQSSQRRSALHEQCLILFITSKAIMFPVATRWWAELFSIARASDLGKALLAVRADQMNLTGVKAQQYRALLVEFQGIIDLLPPIIAIGRVWEKWQTILSSGTRVTLSYWPQAVRMILQSVSVEKEAEARIKSDVVADIICDMRNSVNKRLANIPLIALAAELLDPATTHHANEWAINLHERVSEFLLDWIDAIAAPLATSSASKWGGALPMDVVQKTRKHAFMEELKRVGNMLDAFNVTLRSSADRMKVRIKLKLNKNKMKMNKFQKKKFNVKFFFTGSPRRMEGILEFTTVRKSARDSCCAASAVHQCRGNA